MRKREVVYCYINGAGKEEIQKVSTKNENDSVGYNFDTDVLRVWISTDSAEETTYVPLHRVVFVREVSEK